MNSEQICNKDTYHYMYIAIYAIYIYVLTINLFYEVLHANFEHSMVTASFKILYPVRRYLTTWNLYVLFSVSRELSPLLVALNQSWLGVAMRNTMKRVCLLISVCLAMYTQLLKPPHVFRHQITIRQTIPDQACSRYNRRGDAGVRAS